MTQAIENVVILLIYVTGVTFSGCFVFAVIAVFSRIIKALNYQQNHGYNRRTALKKYKIY